MKLGLPAKLAIVLLMASPFAYAEFECLPLTGSTQLMSVSSSGCPARGYKTVGTTQCEVLKVIPSSGQGDCLGVEGEWFGTYRYTGYVFIEEPEEPNPDPPIETVDVEVPYENIPAMPNPSGNIPLATNNILSSTNAVAENLSNFSKKMGVALTKMTNDINSSKQESVRAYNQSVANFYELNALKNVQYNVLDQVVQNATLATTRNLENRDLHKQTRDKIQELQDDTDVIMEEIPKLESITSTLGGVVDGVGALQSLASQAETRDYEISDYTQNTMNNLAQRMIDYRQQGYNEYNDLVSRITAISGGGSEQPCGISIGDPPCPPEGGDGFTAIDSQNLQTVASTSQEIASEVRSLGYGVDDLESAVGDVQDSVEDVEDAVDSMRSALSDDLYYTSGQLGEKLDAINTTLQSGTGGSGDDDSETNQKLDGIQQSLDAFTDTTGMAQQLNESVTNTNSELSSEMDTMFEGFGTQEKITQLQTTVSGMVNDSGLSDYDSVDKVRNSLADATTISQIFDVSRASCSPYQFWQKEIDFCPTAQKSSMVLEYFIWAITAIFAFLHITAFLSKLRTE